jgi:hypothetical protein
MRSAALFRSLLRGQRVEVGAAVGGGREAGGLGASARAEEDDARYGRPAPDWNAQALEACPPAPPAPTRARTWAALIPRVFDLDVRTSPRCGGRLRVIATVSLTV